MNIAFVDTYGLMVSIAGKQDFYTRKYIDFLINTHIIILLISLFMKEFNQ